MVIWIIGKSGAGKSYFARLLVKNLKKKVKKVFWIDGDNFRKKYSRDLGYSIKDRKKNSLRIQNFYKKKEKINDVVICSLLSIFKDHQRKNQKIFRNYFQIYLKVKDKILQQRNKKNIYSKKLNVVGKDIKFPEPFKSNIVIKNQFNKKKSLINLKKILNKINDKL